MELVKIKQEMEKAANARAAFFVHGEKAVIFSSAGHPQ